MNARSTGALRALLTVMAIAVLQTACGGDNPVAPEPGGEMPLQELDPEAILWEELSRRGLATSWYRGCIWTTFRQHLPSYRGRSLGFILRDIRQIIDFCIDAEPPGEEEPAGALEVVTSTTGEEADGYTLSIDGGLGIGIEANDSHTASGLAPGNHETALSGVPQNCTVEGENPRVVEVVSNTTTTTTFAIYCEAMPPPGPPTGSIRAITSTGGADVDPDGYTLSIGGALGTPMAVDDTLTTPDLTPGDYQVELTGVGANCTVAGDNPRMVTVTAGATSDALFEVTCSEDETSGAGDLRVITESTTLSKDDDGFMLVFEGGAESGMAANDTLTFENLTAGDYVIELTDVAEDCSVEIPNPREVSVVADSVVETVFKVGCAGSSMDVITVTTGVDIDPDGYSVEVNGAGNPIGVNDTVTPFNVGEGANDVELQFVAGNCHVEGDNPRIVMGIRGAKVTTTFEVVCEDVDSGDRSGDIVFEGNRMGSKGIWIMNADGTDQEMLPGNAGDGDPDVSPDGTKIAFHGPGSGSGLDIFVMDIDGSHRTQLTFGGTIGLASPQAPAWSPDGSKIAFMAIPASGLIEIFVMDADGSDVAQLTSSGGGQGSATPSWSPDGTKIVFASDRDGQFDIWIMDADGSDEVKLTDDEAVDVRPVFSPDGTKIAFESDRDDDDGDVYVMDAGGSDITRLTDDPAVDFWPAWSPDGQSIAFQSNRSGVDTIWVMDADGSNQTNVSVQGSDGAPAWVP